jgi:hypothetical protein
MTTTRKFWWFEGDAIHFDARLYAELRGISQEQADKELRELLAKILPGVPIRSAP